MSNSPFRRVRLPSGFPGRPYLTHLPGYYRPVQVHTAAWPSLVAGCEAHVLCLVGKAERDRKSPEYDQFVSAIAIGERWIEFPVQDRSVPKDFSSFLRVLDRMSGILTKPDSVLVIHCGAGVGRAGTVAASLLVRLGLSAEEALAAVEGAGSGPETPWQRRFVVATPPPLRASVEGGRGGLENSERMMVRRLLEQFDSAKIRDELATCSNVRHYSLVAGESELARLMRCIQISDIEIKGRSLNEILESAFGYRSVN